MVRPCLLGLVPGLEYSARNFHTRMIDFVSFLAALRTAPPPPPNLPHLKKPRPSAPWKPSDISGLSGREIVPRQRLLSEV